MDVLFYQLEIINMNFRSVLIYMSINIGIFVGNYLLSKFVLFIKIFLHL